MTSSSIFTLVVGIVMIAGFVGWVQNIFGLVGADFEKPYKAEAIRTIGVFIPPVGAVVGYVTFEEEAK